MQKWNTPKTGKSVVFYKRDDSKDKNAGYDKSENKTIIMVALMMMILMTLVMIVKITTKTNIEKGTLRVKKWKKQITRDERPKKQQQQKKTRQNVDCKIYKKELRLSRRVTTLVVASN